jgi:hypothetical protein
MTEPSAFDDVGRSSRGMVALDRPSVLLIADERSAGTDAIAACAARLLGPVAWNEADVRLERQGLCRAILAEASGVPDAVLERVLPLLADLVDAGDACAVIVLDPEQIDCVAGLIGSAPIDLLCSPTATERVASLCLALIPAAHRLHDIGGTPDSVRLMRLNEEIARIAETLTRLTRGEDEMSRSTTVSDPGLTYRSRPVLERPDIRVRDVRDAIRARRLRDQFFGLGLFEDPAWDMLLDLFAAELERVQVSVSSLCIAAAVPPTTALRWIARMTDAGLFERRPDPFDRRRAFMALSSRASLAMRNYVAAARHAGAMIG